MTIIGQNEVAGLYEVVKSWKTWDHNAIVISKKANILLLEKKLF